MTSFGKKFYQKRKISIAFKKKNKMLKQTR